MIIRISGIWLFTTLTIFIIGCSSSNNNSNSFTKFPVGRELYLSKCTACHKAYERELYSYGQWEKILNEMGKKAKLTSTEKVTMLNYLTERN